MKENSLKICPLIKQHCVTARCNLFNTTLNRCEISLLNYNLYRLFEVESKRLGSISPEDEKLHKARKKDDLGITPLDGVI